MITYLDSRTQELEQKQHVAEGKIKSLEVALDLERQKNDIMNKNMVMILVLNVIRTVVIVSGI